MTTTSLFTGKPVERQRGRNVDRTGKLKYLTLFRLTILSCIGTGQKSAPEIFDDLHRSGMQSDSNYHRMRDGVLRSMQRAGVVEQLDGSPLEYRLTEKGLGLLRRGTGVAGWVAGRQVDQ